MKKSQPKNQFLPKRIWAVLNFRMSLDYLAYPVIIYLLLMLIPERPWLVELLSNVLCVVLLLSSIIFLVMVALRRWRSVAVWTIPTLAFLFLFGGLFLPPFSPKRACNPGDPSCMRLRVMTFNMFASLIVDRLPQIDLMRDSGADIIALQELDSDGIEAVKSELEEIYPYQALLPLGVGGTGIISKFPIVDYQFFSLTIDGLNNTVATIDVNGRPITVISAHPRPPFSKADFSADSLRLEDISRLAEMASSGGPTLLMGDFNMSDQSSIYPTLKRAGLGDSFREVGWGIGLTWPARLIPPIERFIPVVRLDYIWHTDDFTAESAWVGKHALSDHLAVTADLVYEW